jgi:CheY-like chemotaxis protein
MNKTIVLLVSDPVIRRVICKALEREGYCVLEAGDIGKAVERIKECMPDLLMVRHYTETMSGHEAAKYLRSMCPGVPVLIVGGILDDDELTNREFLQRFEVFPKPFKGVLSVAVRKSETGALRQPIVPVADGLIS